MQANTFFQRVFRQLPILFPLVALFHLALLGYTVFTFARDGVLDTFICAGSCIELLLYSALWIGACDRRRVAAIGYIILTAVNLLLYFCTPKFSAWHLVSNVLVPFDVLMCFFLLFYYKRFR